MTFWLKNLHRTLCFYVTVTYNCNTVSAILTGATFNKKWALQNSDNSSYNVFSIEAGSPNRMHDVWVEAEWQRKGNSICMNIKSWWDWMLPGIVPLVIEAKWRGQNTVQIFQDGTGQHEKVQLHFWGLGGGKGSGDGASVTWSPHSLGRSHHQTLHSQGHLSAVLSIRLQVRPLSSSSFLCFAVKANKIHFKRCTLYRTTHIKFSGSSRQQNEIINWFSRETGMLHLNEQILLVKIQYRNQINVWEEICVRNWIWIIYIWFLIAQLE